jgi:D-alanyl-D-alanine carboxypeptidase
VPTAAAQAVPTPPPRGFSAEPPTPAPTLTASQAAQQQFCDQASPGAHLPLPIDGPSVFVPQPRAPTQPVAVSGGPRQEGADPPPDVSAEHVAVIDDESGKLLYSKEPFTRVAPASITKIATTIVALEHQPDLGTVYTTTVSATALVACDGSSVMGLEPGDHVRLETLLYGMMLPSGNDAAEQVAVSVGGSREGFVAWMNQKVAELGLHDTHFVTPSGMDADNHYSSAYDMALISRYAMQNPTFRTIVATPRFVGDDYYMHNLNSLLGVYPGADGVKIGYTDIAGHTIVASATRDSHRVYVALMHSRDIHTESIKLLDWVWANFRWS